MDLFRAFAASLNPSAGRHRAARLARRERVRLSVNAETARLLGEHPTFDIAREQLLRNLPRFAPSQNRAVVHTAARPSEFHKGD